MEDAIKRLLFTTKDGRWHWETDYALDHLELDDEDIDFDRIPEVRKLLIKPVGTWEELAVPLKAAEVLASWGDKKGLEYLEYVVDLRPDLWGNGEPHRLKGYDTTYEWIARAAAAFSSTLYDRDGSDVARKSIEPIMTKILKLCETQQFEFPFLSTILRRDYREYDKGLRSYLHAVLDDESFHHVKPADAVAFFKQYDPVYLKHTLSEFGRSEDEYG